jgi:hypothetical protein
MHPGNQLDLINMICHYESGINKICDRIEFRRSISIHRTEDQVAKDNEELYKLFAFRNNIKNILSETE